MTWEQEIQLAAAAAADEATKKERERFEQALAEKDREIAELKAKLAAK